MLIVMGSRDTAFLFEGKDDTSGKKTVNKGPCKEGSMFSDRLVT